MNNSPEEILDKIKDSKNIVLSLHRGPDGDSLGSCTAMKYFLEKLGKEVKLVSVDNLPDELMDFDFSKEVEFGKRVEDIKSDFDLFIAVDGGRVRDFSTEEKVEGIFNINIDHHPTNKFFGDINYVIPDKYSCCSILIDLFKSWGVEFDTELSRRLLLGVYTDSGMLSHGGFESLKDAFFLCENGVDYLEVVNKIMYNVPLKLKKYFSLITEKFRIVDFEKHVVGLSSVTLKDLGDLDLSLSEIRYGPNYLQEIRGLDILFTLTETSENIKGSFRSRKNFDVSLIAKELGGGGHKLAAAFKLEKMPLSEAEKKVFEAIKKVGFVKI